MSPLARAEARIEGKWASDGRGRESERREQDKSGEKDYADNCSLGQWSGDNTPGSCAHASVMPIIHDDAFRAWEACAPASFRDDHVWRFHAYRVALYLLDLATSDARGLHARRCSNHQVDQLLRAVGSISTNVSEGFGRSRPADRSRFFGIALGSLRESASWYRAVRADLPEGIADLRFDQLSELRRILIGAQKWLATKPAHSHLV